MDNNIINMYNYFNRKCVAHFLTSRSLLYQLFHQLSSSRFGLGVLAISSLAGPGECAGSSLLRLELGAIGGTRAPIVEGEAFPNCLPV